MNPSAPHPHRRRLTRAEVRRRRRNRAIRRVAGLTVMLCVAAGGVSFLLTRHAVVPSASAASAISMPAQSIADSTVSSAENTAAPANALGLTADEARAMLADPLMVLVNHTSKMPDNYTFDTKECGSATAVNKTLQTVACDAFLEMQKAAAADGVTVWMQSGYRSVDYQPHPHSASAASSTRPASTSGRPNTTSTRATTTPPPRKRPLPSSTLRDTPSTTAASPPT